MKNLSKKKAYLSIFIAMIAVMVIGAGCDARIKEDPATDYEYTITDNKITITKYVGGNKNAVIPANIDECEVTAIGANAFNGCESLKSVVIPEGVTSIGDYAFWECKNLNIINIPSSMTSIGGNAMFNTPWYNRYGNDLIIENHILIGYKGEGSSVVIPNDVHFICDYAFFGCDKVESLTIPDSVTHIGDGAFYGCAGLISLTIPSSVTSMGVMTFAACANLQSVFFEGDAPEIKDLNYEKIDRFKIYYTEGATGWTNPWYGFDTELY